jgi:hypothetical protein
MTATYGARGRYVGLARRATPIQPTPSSLSMFSDACVPSPRKRTRGLGRPTCDWRPGPPGKSDAPAPARSDLEGYRRYQHMRRTMMLGCFVVATLAGWVNLAQAQVSVDIEIHLGSPPQLVAVPSRR